MKDLFFKLVIVSVLCIGSGCGSPPPDLYEPGATAAWRTVSGTLEENPSDAPRVVFTTNKGPIVIELLPEAAPKTVENFLRYVEADFYDQTLIHRVVRGKLIQGGAMNPGFKVKPTYPPIESEVDNGLRNVRGAVAMARLDDADSATSQWFINVSDNPELNERVLWDQDGYTVFGRVIEGMDVVDAISFVETGRMVGLESVPRQPILVQEAVYLPPNLP